MWKPIECARNPSPISYFQARHPLQLLFQIGVLLAESRNGALDLPTPQGLSPAPDGSERVAAFGDRIE